MENINVLQAIERGEKQDQETLQSLKDKGLVDLADVTHMQSSGREFIFVGFTAKGLRLLKQSKVALVTDVEREIIRAVVRRFLDQHEPTSRRTLLKQFKSPITEALQRLGNISVLRVTNNTYLAETYLPRATAFYHCGDSAALAFAQSPWKSYCVYCVIFLIETWKGTETTKSNFPQRKLRTQHGRLIRVSSQT